MAATAAIQATRQKFDLFGAIVLGVVTAVGGGTLRDLLIGATPVFWLTDMTYLIAAVPVAFATYYLSKGFGQSGGKRLRLLQYLDAVGLALFTLTGVQIALLHGLPSVSVVVLGCITGVAGGMFRDLLSGLQPAILKQDLYATISLVGGCIYVGMLNVTDQTSCLIIAFVAMLLFRWIVLYRNDKHAG